MRRVESKRSRGTVGGIELVLVEHLKTMRGHDRSIRNSEFLEIGFVIAQEPAAEIGGAEPRIVEFDGVLKRQIGMAENLVDDRIGGRQEIAFAGRYRASEADDVSAAVRETALRNCGLLRSETHGSDEQASR